MNKLIKGFLLIVGVTAISTFIKHEKKTLKQIKKTLFDLRYNERI